QRAVRFSRRVHADQHLDEIPAPVLELPVVADPAIADAERIAFTAAPRSAAAPPELVPVREILRLECVIDVAAEARRGRRHLAGMVRLAFAGVAIPEIRAHRPAADAVRVSSAVAALLGQRSDVREARKLAA